MQRVIINGNGDDRKTLKDQLKNAFLSLLNTKSELNKMTIHGRNYQTNETPQHDFASDLRDHQDAMQKLREVEEYITKCRVNLSP